MGKKDLKVNKAMRADLERVLTGKAFTSDVMPVPRANQLVSAGILQEFTLFRNTPGRPAKIWILNPDKRETVEKMITE